MCIIISLRNSCSVQTQLISICSINQEIAFFLTAILRYSVYEIFLKTIEYCFQHISYLCQKHRIKTNFYCKVYVLKRGSELPIWCLAVPSWPNLALPAVTHQSTQSGSVQSACGNCQQLDIKRTGTATIVYEMLCQIA